MKRVKEENYPDFLELAGLNTCNTVYPMAIAEGVQRGEIYTDDADKHQYALFWHEGGFSYISGRPKPDDLGEIYALNGIHDVPLSDRALALIQISREQNPDGVYIFEKDGKPLSPRTYDDHVKAFCRSIGVKELSNYTARRLFVSELETSKNHQELMKVMGWSTDNTRHYATSLDDDLYDAVTLLGNTETQ